MNKTSSVNNKKIFKNTVALYARMLLSMIVSLYTSRIVLNALGVDDYGIYGLVGGIVVLFSFLNVTMSGATSRFLTVELAKNDPRQLQQTFNTAALILSSGMFNFSNNSQSPTVSAKNKTIIAIPICNIKAVLNVCWSCRGSFLASSTVRKREVAPLIVTFKKLNRTTIQPLYYI